MAFGIVSLLPFLFIIAIVYFFVSKRNKTIMVPLMIRFNRKSHFYFIIGYIVLLIIALVISEAVEQKTVPPVKAITVSDYPELDHALSIKTINEAHFLEKRTHPAGQTLSIDNSNNEVFVYIERKKNNDGIIEEFIFHPSVFANGHNVSHKAQVTKPIWNSNTMTVPKQRFNDIPYVSFHDSEFLSQMTNTNASSTWSSFSSSSSSISGVWTVYLLVPDDVEIDTAIGFYIEYVE